MLEFRLSAQDWAWLCQVLSNVYHDLESDDEMKEDIERVASALDMVENGAWKSNPTN